MFPEATLRFKFYLSGVCVYVCVWMGVWVIMGFN